MSTSFAPSLSGTEESIIAQFQDRVRSSSRPTPSERDHGPDNSSAPEFKETLDNHHKTVHESSSSDSAENKTTSKESGTHTERTSEDESTTANELTPEEALVAPLTQEDTLPETVLQLLSTDEALNELPFGPLQAAANNELLEGSLDTVTGLVTDPLLTPAEIQTTDEANPENELLTTEQAAAIDTTLTDDETTLNPLQTEEIVLSTNNTSTTGVGTDPLVNASTGTQTITPQQGQQATTNEQDKAAETQLAANTNTAIGKGTGVDLMKAVQPSAQVENVSMTPQQPAQAAATPIPTSLVPEPTPADNAISKQVHAAVLQQNMQDTNRSLTLRLTPPELGTVRIHITEHHGAMSIRLTAEDDSVRLSLERALPNLREDLRAADAPINSVNLTDFNFMKQQQEQAQQQRKQRQNNDTPFSIDGLPPAPEQENRTTVNLGGRVTEDSVSAIA